jgi:hypothetical protein
MRGIIHSEDFSWSNAPRTGSGGGTNTVTQSQQIPAFEQQFSQENQDLARALSQNPYPQYNQPLVQGFSDQQQQGMAQAGQAAGAYQPDLATAEQYANDANPYWNTGINVGINEMGSATQQAAPGVVQGQNILGGAINAGPNGQTIAQYMSPYVQQSLNPQIQNLRTQLGQEQNALNAQATQAGAFGDSRQGTAQALLDNYANQNLAGIVGQGYNTAYNNAVNTALSEQAQQGQLGAAMSSSGLGYGNLLLGQGQGLANAGLNQVQAGLNRSNQLSNLGQLQQSLGISGANALFNAGQQQQTLGQQELNQAYQQFLNQANWPYQMLNIRESALSNSPYNMVNATTVPQANMAAQGFGATLSGIGSLGSLLSSNSGSNNAPFGGATMQGSH